MLLLPHRMHNKKSSITQNNQSRDNDFDIYDLLDDEDGSIESTFAKEYATHHGGVIGFFINRC